MTSCSSRLATTTRSNPPGTRTAQGFATARKEVAGLPRARLPREAGADKRLSRCAATRQSRCALLASARAAQQNTDVADRDPYAAVVAELTAPADFAPEPESVPWTDDRVPQARLMSHGPFAGDPAAIAVLKQRESDDRRLYAVSFDDPRGNRWFWLVAAGRARRDGVGRPWRGRR
jgi:hypothetical protein